MVSNDNPLAPLNMNASVSDIWYYGTGLFSLLCLLCGSLSNGLVLYVFIRNSSLRQPRNLFLINLAVTDLGLLLTSCDFYAFSGGLCAFTSIATMAAIALTRLVAVLRPFSSLKLTTTVTLKCIACCWLYGLILMIAPFFGWSRFVFEGFGTSCTFDYVSKDVWNRVFMLILIVVGFSVPLAIIIVSYSFILVKLTNRGRHLVYKSYSCTGFQRKPKLGRLYFFVPISSTHNEPFSNEGKVIFTFNESNQTKRDIRRTEIRVTRTALVICGIYVMSWTPYALMTIAAQFGLDRLVNVYSASLITLSTKISACINPFIYALSSSAFRRHLGFYSNLLFACRKRSNSLSTSTLSIHRKTGTPSTIR
ncbi:unnamed protein product [Adineta ricciae]|uniref:G-protein coupled receptors family 1 profile domain-containing protein n=1 Tax=Adineta ricciae TaxID=249248 RepID=A0A815RP33_ADIRI|nr:unnamed protein product [Adineta ricciae]CAF1479015.1 unnamed protein product [Adineta ricciae]